MLSQKEFVEGCYNWYREADLQPGNPEDGDWDEAHYPVPRCKGGTETILLLREHHAIQGVIQSEELQWMCIFNWERKYLSGEYLELFYKWKSEGMKVAHARRTPEQKILFAEKMRANAISQWDRLTEEERVQIGERMSSAAYTRQAQMTEEEKILWTESIRAKTVAQHARMTEEERIIKAEKLRAYHAQMTEEEKILRAEKCREKCRAKAIAQRAREKFNKEVEDLVAVWEMGLRP